MTTQNLAANAETTAKPGETLLSVENMKMYFPVTSGLFLQRKVADVKAVDGLTFDVKRGETLGLVGESGCGKSTIVNLIPRFYECNSGQILIDDIVTEDYTLESLRNQIALVTQQIFLFNGSILENIAYSDSTASRKKVLEAAKRAFAVDFIEQLPEGLDTQVGDDGVLLSGGERQRIAIARALLKDSPILILDEATSALDTESEQNIQEAMNNLMIGRTTFIITHRLSTIEKADIILVIDKGRIVESGTHNQLLAESQIYNQLQSGNFETRTLGESS